MNQIIVTRDPGNFFNEFLANKNVCRMGVLLVEALSVNLLDHHY